MKKSNLILVFLIVALAISCKKETVNTETDNPNITHRVINKELISKAEFSNDYIEIDIDNNGVNDFVLEMYIQKFSESVRLLGATANNVSLGTSSGSEDPFIVNNLSKNTVINASSTTYSQLSYLAAYNSLFAPIIEDYGYAGKGDVLVGFQFEKDGQKHYGWLLASVSASRKYAIVKEVAYDIRPNMEIKAGEK